MDARPEVVVVAGPADQSAADRFVAAGAEHGLAVVAALPSGAGSALADLVGGGGRPIGIVGCGPGGETALVAAAGEGRVAAAVLFGSPMSRPTLALVEEWPELAVLSLADPRDRPGLKGAVELYLASSHDTSQVLVGPLDDGALGVAARWLRDRLVGTALVEEVALSSADGWELYGTRWLPLAAEPVPGVVLLHSGRSDRAVFARLQRLLADRGLAVLNIDWRGRGRSTNRGTYFSLDPEERAAGWRDAAAAFEHLAACEGVDGQQLGAVGVIHGAEHAVRASQHDPRVRALAILTGYRPVDDEAAHLTSGAVDVLYVTSSGHRITTTAMRSLYDATPRGHAHYIEYPGGTIGYQLFELDHGLEPTIVSWLAEVLAR